ncbi:MAG: cytidylate kinase [Gammaproteobacteria bacterium]|nr:cytidylate kinase [Gammaproteobacteria bacterium]
MEGARPPVITIDGPSASGKGAVSEFLSRKIGFNYLDSGLLYRLFGLEVLSQGISLSVLADDWDESKRLVNCLEARIDGRKKVNQNVSSSAISIVGSVDARTEQAGAFASKIAKMPTVREALLDLQRSFRVNPGLIADGRDMGTVVFPDALLKIFLTASPSRRAERRHKQLKDKGIDVSVAKLERELEDRDYHDSTRGLSPLKFLEDSMIIDSTDLDVEQVSFLIEKKLGEMLED